MTDYQSPDYRRSRAAYIAQCAVEYFVALLVTDAFLAKLLAYAGISDALVGVISSFITLAFVVQLATIFLVRVRVSVKNLVLILDTVSVAFFALLYFTPFLPVGQSMRTALVVISVFLAYTSKYLIVSIYFKWANSFVDPAHRAGFSALKEIVSLVGGMLFSLGAGAAVDRFEGAGNPEGAFLFLAIAILALNIVNFVTILLIRKDDPLPPGEKKDGLRTVLKLTLGTANFRHVVVMDVIWAVARYITVGFMGTFKTKDLMLSVFAIQIINIGASLVRVAVSRWFGRYSDRHSFARGFELALWIEAAAFLVAVFTTGVTWYLVIAYTVLMSVSAAGTGQNSFNITYSYVDGRCVTQALALKSCISGLFGFGASLLGSRILRLVQENGNRVFGLPVYGQQILSAVSFLLIVVLIVYVRTVIEKQKIIVQ
ncbi:MAG: hypothetical protein J5849_02325 [Clostridia bacterium]|nr:hypothetical protein [Clostridia bacterium]